MMSDTTETRHASCVAINQTAILIEGKSGSGKSDLALRLLDRGAVLVSDDYTRIERRGDQIWAVTAPNIAGKMEVRGLGIVDMPNLGEAKLGLIIELASNVERYPFDQNFECILGINVPIVSLTSFEASSPIKVELALKRIKDA
jgi:serine kinase of HPr protein (carbohydrate metabolism regulator)